MKSKILIILLLVFNQLGFSQKLVPCTCTDSKTGKKTYGYADTLYTKYIIKCQFDSACEFKESLARVIKDGKTGYIGKTGAFVIPASFDKGADFSEGFALVTKGKRNFYIDKTGRDIFKKNFYDPTSAIPDVMKKMFASQIETMVDNMDFHEGKVVVSDSASKTYSYMDKTGKKVLTGTYVAATYFSEGLAFVRETQTSATKVINSKGETVFELKGEVMPEKSFKNGIAIIRYKPEMKAMNAFNYVDKAGNYLLSGSVTVAKPFQDGYAVVTNKDGNMELIDTKGKKVIDQVLRYIEPSPIKGMYFYSNKTDRGYGLMDIKGNRKSEAKYVNFTKLNDTIFLCKQWGTSIYLLMSTKSGSTTSGWFTDYYWRVENNKQVLRLYGGLFNEELDFEPSTGIFRKDGKVLSGKDNFYFVSGKVDDSKLKPGTIVYENKAFTLTFPEEMQVFKDTVDKKVFNHSTFYMAVEKIKYNGTGSEYIDRMKTSLESGGKFENVEKTLRLIGDKNVYSVIATTKEAPGKYTAKYYYVAVDTSDGLYIIFGNYFAIDEKIDGPRLNSTINSLKFK